MKSYYTILFIIIAIAEGFCVGLTFHSKRKIAKILRIVFFWALVSIIANVLLTYTENIRVADFAYSLFFGSINWVIYYMLRFTTEYTAFPLSTQKVFRPFLKILLTIDSLSMFLNLFFHHAFTTYPVVTSHGEQYFHTLKYVFYNVHLIFAYILSAAILLVLLGKVFKTPALYWRKYFIVIFIMVFLLGTDALFVFTQKVIDLSILSFAFGSYLLCYVALIYKPKALINRMHRYIVENLADSILFFDADKTCIYINEIARERFHIDPKNLEAVGDLLQPWLRKAKADLRRDSYTAMYSGSCNGPTDPETNENRIYLFIEFHRMYEKGKLLGSFFRVQDRTTYMNNLMTERYSMAHDPLTGLYNRDHLCRRIEERLMEDPDGDYLVISSDIKNFKLINDIFGKSAGDAMLCRIADALRDNASEDTIYGRLGSDKFGLMMRRERFRENLFIEGPNQIIKMEDNLEYPVIVHIGVYEVSERRLPASVMFDRSNIAMQTIKDDYQNRIAYYNDTVRQKLLWDQKLSGELEEGLRLNQFLLYLQPQADHFGRVKGGEALVRWDHPSEGFLLPGTFIETFEQNGRIAALDRYVWERACQLLQKWKEEGHNEMYISVNISQKDFYFLDIYQTLSDLVDKYQIDPGRLHLEITETAMMADMELKQEIIHKFHAKGFCVEMDDFGKGYSSLNVLKDLPVDVIKTDMEFLDDSVQPERAEKILKVIMKLAASLQIEVITEGVVSQEQVDFLKGLGCHTFQGTYIAPPMAVTDFEQRYMA
ncbi:MAG: EAL domain-containing protein [Lachnospiraceae bacterium]|nr:EAL domain-containing protein [Lachnospiraceae bacterium]